MDEFKENIQKWCNALRSGEYEQAAGLLQNSKGFCCLGVACMEFIPKDKRLLRKGTGHLEGSTPDYFQLHSPRWLRGINRDFERKTYPANLSLVDLNDSGKYSFDEIADCLEAVYIHEVLK